MEETNKINQIFQKLLEKNALKDNAANQDWRAEEENNAIYKELEKVVDWSEDYQADYQPDVEKGLSRLKNRINEHQQQEKQIERFKARRFYISLAAAVALLVATVAVWQLWLNSGVIKVVAQSERKMVELEDGSIVYLNKNSQLQYADNFGDCNRVVQLSGEAFFDVAKNADCPFRVETTQSTITVLGTSFNVRAASNEATTEVIVTSGQVEVMSNKSGQKTILLPQDKVIHQHGRSLTKTKDKNYHAVAWHTLDFRNEKMQVIAKEMEQHFDVQIDLSQTLIQNCTYTVKLNKKSLEQIFSTWTASFGIEVEQAGNGTFVLKGGYENCSNFKNEK